MANPQQKNGILSHIQVPKSIIKLFENERHFLYSYDVVTKKIKNDAHAANLNVEQGYYSADVEEELSKKIEKPYADLVHLVASKHLESTSYAASTFEEYKPGRVHDTVLNYSVALILRNPALVESLKLDTIFYPLLSDQQQHGRAITSGFRILSKKGTFDNFGVTIAVNRTDIPFVITMNGMATMVNSKFGKWFVISATPVISFIVVEKSNALVISKDEEQGSQVLRMFEFGKDIVIKTNEVMTRQQIDRKKGFIASADKELLERLTAKYRAS